MILAHRHPAGLRRTDGTVFPADLEWWRPEAAAAAAAGRGSDASPVPAAPGGSVPFAALMAFTFILLLAPQSFIPALEPLRLALVSAGAAVIAHLSERFARRRPVITFTRETRIAACLAVWALATVPLSYWPAGSLQFLSDTYLKTLIVFWLLSSVVVTRQRIRLVAWALSLMVLPLALTALHNYHAGIFVMDAGPHGLGRILGYASPLAGNPNDLALTLNLILPLTLALFLLSRRTIVKAALLVMMLVDLLAVFATFSRGGFLTLAVVLTVYLARLPGRSRRFWGLLALVVVCALLLPPTYLEHMSTITSISSDPTGSAQDRWSDQAAAARFLLSNPLVGVGAGMNILAMNAERGAYWRVVHNVYLQFALELGLVGLVLFVALLMGCLRKVGAVRRMTARDPDLADLFLLAEAIQVSLIAFAVAALFHPVGYHFYFYYIAALGLGLAAAHESVRAGAAGGRHAD